MQKADGFDAAQNHENIEEPEENEADRGAGVEPGPARSEGHDHGVDGFAANPSLNAKPAAGDERAKNRGNIGAENAERSARKNRKGNAVLRAGVRVEEHRNEHQDVAEKNGEKRLAPIHAAGDHAAGQHVGGNVDAHGDPESGVVVGAPAAARRLDGREIFVIEGARFDGAGAKSCSIGVAHGSLKL